MEELLNYIRILKRRWPIALNVFLTILVIGFISSIRQQPQYRAKGRILVSPDSLSYLNQPNNQIGSNLSNEMAIIESENLARVVIKELNLDTKASKLLNNFDVVNPQDTSILEFSYLSSNPEEAAKILNAWMESYVGLAKQSVLSENLSFQQFLESQIPKSQEELRLAAENLKSFKQKNRILDINTESSELTSTISQLDEEIDSINVELATARTELQSLQEVFGTDNSQEAIFSTFISESPLAASMLEELQRLQNEIDKEKIRFGENHPQVLSLQKQAELQRQQLREYVNKVFVGDERQISQFNDVDQILQPGAIQKQLVQQYWETQRRIQALEQRLQSLEALNASYKERINEIPELEFQQKQLEREVAAREQILNNLIKNNQEIQVSLNRQPTNLELIQYAEVPQEATYNARRLILWQTLGTGIVLAWLSAFIVDKLDNKIYDIKDVRRVFKSPVLAEIPQFFQTNLEKNDENSQLTLLNSPTSEGSEAFRILFTRSNLAQDTPKTILVSSTIPQEGKSTVAANLGLVGAELGLRVLLIEAQLRNPSQSKIWNSQKESGLVSFLKGSSDIASIPRLIISKVKNLDILAAEKLVSNPLNLVGSERMRELLTYARQNYDLVIIDSGAIAKSAEVPILGKMVDGILIVARLGNLTQTEVKNSQEIIAESNLPLIGLVHNCVSNKSKNEKPI